MTQLNQMLAVRKGLRARTEAAVTSIYQQFQKPALFSGLARTYQPRADDGEVLPAEKQLVQKNVENLLTDAGEALTKLYDVMVTVDKNNMEAHADLAVDGNAIAEDLPVPFLLFLEKQLVDWRTVITHLPVLDPEIVWSADHQNGGARSEDVTTTRARKIPTVLTKAPATDKHPAQTEVYMRDEIVGDWTLTRFSGAVSAERKRQLAERCDKALDAVRQAVQEANSEEVSEYVIGSSLFDYLLAP